MASDYLIPAIVGAASIIAGGIYLESWRRNGAATRAAERARRRDQRKRKLRD